MTTQPEATPPVPGIVRAYQVLATVVGVNLLVVMAGFGGKLLTDDLSWWNREDVQDTFKIIDQVHGLLFMALLVIIAIVSRRFSWKPNMTISTMLMATIPFVSFYAERRASKALVAKSQTLGS